MMGLALVLLLQPEFVPVPGGFAMMKTEVTVGQFEAFVKATGYRTAAERANTARNWKNPGFPVDARQPVVYVTVNDAVEYCAWIGARLPSDAEWETAARAGTTTRHYWGEALDERYLWYRGNSGGTPQPVATKLPNAWGLHDMEGNVWEWSLSPTTDGSRMGNRRGGSFIDCADIETKDGKPAPLIAIGTFYRSPAAMEHRYDDIGFRCVK
ncbi:MAG: formylglycine-generating enzyme family protein [Bryobacter sp.]|jgi:formylglycine-generating enzyme required for sulfatase activity|nr:formylglycine-generating enzyme family protein [Bryobacter sp.]